MIESWWNPTRSNPHAAYVGPLMHAIKHAKAGPGIHTDEASSALPDMGHLLPSRDEAVLAKLSPTKIVAIPDDDIRENPSSSGYSLVIAPRDELFPISYLVTGTWGAPPNIHRVVGGEVEHDGRAWAGTAGAPRYLPMYSGARENPHDAPADFFERMNKLHEELTNFRARVVQRYASTLEERRTIGAKKRAVSVAKAAAKRAEKGLPPLETKTDNTDPEDAWLPEIDKMMKAVDFVRLQEMSARRTHQFSIFDSYGVPFGDLSWGPLAEGNGKLNFLAYSETPMSTCPGAGECGIPLDFYNRRMARTTKKTGAPAGLDSNALKAYAKTQAAKDFVKQNKKSKVQGKKPKATAKAGWCYSFKAFRRAAAFSRMFLNTLANTADREAAIWRAVPIGQPIPGQDEYETRVMLALKGAAHRRWQGYVKQLALEGTKDFRSKGKVAFIRLFVDGDIGYEDSILAWMQVCREIGPGGIDIPPGGAHIEAYGYSKCWNQFLNADRILASKGMSWPSNYTVNLSSGSVYANSHATKANMNRLPITRGEFVAVDLKSYVPELRRQTELLLAAAKGDPKSIVIPMPKEQGPGIAGLDFKPERIRDFLLLQSVSTKEDVLRMFPDVNEKTLAKKTPEQLQHIALTKYLDGLLTDSAFGVTVKREALKDAGKLLEKELTTGKVAKKKLVDKALALVLHETLWSFGLGGSCPLICGNCSDHPTDPAEGVHRCASKTTLRHRNVSIGLH